MKDKQQITNELFNAQYELNSAKLRYIRLGQREMLSSEGSELREKIIRSQERIEILTWMLGFEDKDVKIKKQHEIVVNILNGMDGIGGIPSNESFYAEFAQRWIPVEEELPTCDKHIWETTTPVSDFVIVMYDNGEWDKGLLCNEKWYDKYGERGGNVTHWRPIELK